MDRTGRGPRGRDGARDLPSHRDNPSKTEHNVGAIFANNVAAIVRADLMVASLNGVTTDDGTAWEIGYAYATQTPIVGLHTDWRSRFDTEIVNLMIERSVEAIVHSLEDLAAYLESGKSYL